MQGEQAPITGSKGSVVQEKKQENLAEKSAKADTVNEGQIHEKNEMPQTNAAEIKPMMEKDSLKTDYAMLQRQIDEIKKAIEELRIQITSLEK